MFDGSKKIFEKLKRNDSIDIVAIDDDHNIYSWRTTSWQRTFFLTCLMNMWRWRDSSRNRQKRIMRRNLTGQWWLGIIWILYEIFPYRSHQPYIYSKTLSHHVSTKPRCWRKDPSSRSVMGWISPDRGTSEVSSSRICFRSFERNIFMKKKKEYKRKYWNDKIEMTLKEGVTFW